MYMKSPSLRQVKRTVCHLIISLSWLFTLIILPWGKVSGSGKWCKVFLGVTLPRHLLHCPITTQYTWTCVHHTYLTDSTFQCTMVLLLKWDLKRGLRPHSHQNRNSGFYLHFLVQILVGTHQTRRNVQVVPEQLVWLERWFSIPD